MNKLQVFNFNQNQVRTVLINNEPYFVGKDVAEVLGYTNPRDAISNHVYDEDKGVELIDTLGGKQKMTVINESGLYALVFGSRLENAKTFKHWVTSEVLPAIRKTGGYHLPNNYKEALVQLIAQVEENEKLQLENKEMQPKADFYDEVTGSTDTVEMATVSKLLNVKNMGRTKLFQFLRDQKILQGNNQPYQTYVDRGYFRIVESKFAMPNGDIHINYKTVVFQKGVDFIRRKLKENGYS